MGSRCTRVGCSYRLQRELFPHPPVRLSYLPPLSLSALCNPLAGEGHSIIYSKYFCSGDRIPYHAEGGRGKDTHARPRPATGPLLAATLVATAFAAAIVVTAAWSQTLHALIAHVPHLLSR